MSSYKAFSLIIALNSLFGTVYCANILYVSATASVSHHIWDTTLATALKNSGHAITFVSHTREKNSSNFSTIFLEGINEKQYENRDIEDIVDETFLYSIKRVGEWVRMSCEHDLKTQGYKQLLQLSETKIKFDLIIIDILSGPCFYSFVELFGYPPTIATSPFGISPFVADIFGVDLDSSEIPHFAYRVFPPLSFSQRMINYIANLYDLKLKNEAWNRIQDMLTNFYGREMSHIMNIERNFSILLPNYDPILDFPRSLPPNVIPVGGLHCKRAKSLPEDLQNYLDNSKYGVILFSLGTNVRSDQLKESKKKIILETFSKLKQNVIWKFESDIENLPKNVIVRKFLPQNDIVAHPNLILVVNHGGALSTQEAMYHGKPIISIPFFIDQFSIANKIMNRKLGLNLNFLNLTVDYMLSAFEEVILNPLYKKNAKLTSQHYKDRPKGPLDRAVFWVEHVIRNGGADHLKIGNKKQPFYQKEMLDVWAFILIIFIVICVVVRKVICYISSRNTLKMKTKVQ